MALLQDSPQNGRNNYQVDGANSVYSGQRERYSQSPLVHREPPERGVIPGVDRGIRDGL